MTSQAWGAPAPGDIVWCHFPQAPAATPGPKPRPALVTSVTLRDNGVSVIVAYGTSQKLDRLKAGEFSITKAKSPSAYVLAGLAYDTKFDLKAIAELPWTAQFFKVPPRAQHGQTPKLGTLHPSLLRAAQAAFAAAQT